MLVVGASLGLPNVEIVDDTGGIRKKMQELFSVYGNVWLRNTGSAGKYCAPVNQKNTNLKIIYSKLRNNVIKNT